MAAASNWGNTHVPTEVERMGDRVYATFVVELRTCAFCGAPTYAPPVYGRYDATVVR